MIELELEDEFRQQYLDNPRATAWRLESSLREFANIKPVNFWFDYPIHYVDEKGLLSKHFASGDPRANLDKSGKRKQTPESRKEEFDNAFDINKLEDETCEAIILAEYLGISERTVRARVQEFSDEYITEKGIIRRK
jgi:RecA-family ATPase